MKTNKSENLSDGEVLRESLQKPWMFGLLVNRYQKAFLRKSLQMLRSKEEAEDAVQETFLKIYKNALQFSEREEANFSSWAYKILTNNCYDILNRKNKVFIETLEFADLDTAGASSYENPYENTENKSFIEGVMARMPKNLSRLLKLYFLEEKSQKEIAEEENISLVAVRSRIHRAKKYFKEIALQI
jgi:RNA polymerase sigma factor (sigma-70 family)